MLLLATIVGSGIMGTRLAPSSEALALLANAAATSGMLYVLITALKPVSGAHFNPAVSLISRLRGELNSNMFVGYVFAQVIGAITGVILAHAMFDMTLIQSGIHNRTGFSQWLSETVATFGLLLTILLSKHQRPKTTAALVACYIFAAYWFTASTAFANPAVTLARSLTQTFTGIRPVDVIGFVISQLVGALLAQGIKQIFNLVPTEDTTGTTVGFKNH